MKRHFNIVLTGNYGASNLGDDLLLEVLIRGFQSRFPDRSLAVVANPASYLNRWYPGVSILDERSPGRVTADVLVLGGGTQFFSFPGQGPSFIRRVQNWLSYLVHPNRLATRLARSLGKGWQLGVSARYTAAISLGLGPFTDLGQEEEKAYQQMKACAWISVRDRFALNWLIKRGIPKVLRHADLGFASDLWLGGVTGNEPAHREGVIGVVIRHWPHGEEGKAYLEPLLEVATRLRSNGRQVEFLSFAETYDAPTLNAIRDVGGTIHLWDAQGSDIPTFARLLESFALVISARAHGVVMSSALGTPAIAVALEPKLRLICEELPKSIPIWEAPYDPEWLVKKAETMLDDPDRTRELLAEEVGSCATSAQNSLATLLDWVAPRLDIRP